MNILKQIRFFTVIPMILALSACATTDAPYRGKLSDAMEVTSDGYEGERHLEVPETVSVIESETSEPVNTDMTDSTSANDVSHRQVDFTDWKKNVMFYKGGGGVAGSDYRDQNHWAIRVGGENNKRVQSELYLGFESVSLDSGGSLYQSVGGDVNILVAGLNYKHFFSPWSHKIRPYLSAGAGGAYMFWSYRNPFTTSDGKTFTGDNLSGFTISGSVGIEFKPVRFLSVAIEANPKIHLWNERTGGGFSNDEFDPMAMMALSAAISITQ